MLDVQSPPLRAHVRGLATPVLVSTLLCVAIRLPFVTAPLGSDEAGLLLVVRRWGPGSGELYGDYWVDRPPLLLAYFWLADQLPGLSGVRLLGCLVGALLVAAGAVAGQLLNGRAGAWWAGLAAAMLGSSYTIAGHLVNGMVQAAALTMTSCALTLAATRGKWRSPASPWLAAAAGATGVGALLVKQNFVCGLVFGLVVVLASALTGELSSRDVRRALGAGAAGALAVLVALLAWASLVGIGAQELWFALYEFRLLVTEVVASNDEVVMKRADNVVLSFLFSGLALVLGLFVASMAAWRRDRAPRRHQVGILALLVVATVGIVLGGSMWRHYLIQLVPAAVLAAAIVAPRLDWVGVAMRGAVAVAGASSLVGAAIGTVVEHSPPDEVKIGRYLAAAVRDGDTGVVTWGHAEVLLYAGLSSPYPYLWSVPTRTLDPELTELLGTVRGARPPTWVVEWRSFGSWPTERGNELAAVVAQRYRLVGRPCGQKVYLLRGVNRSLPADPCG